MGFFGLRGLTAVGLCLGWGIVSCRAWLRDRIGYVFCAGVESGMPRNCSRIERVAVKWVR